MINPARFLNVLQSEGVEFYRVPDSYLNGFCNYLLGNVPNNKHVIAANEECCEIASGYYFSTNTMALVYMQNSGMGNALNPIISLADRHVPCTDGALIGWRGEPGSGDHPQHQMQGNNSKALEMLDIPVIAEDDDDRLEEQTRWAVETAKTAVIQLRSLEERVYLQVKKVKYDRFKISVKQEDAIEIILDTMPADTIYTATTGRATRELIS